MGPVTTSPMAHDDAFAARLRGFGPVGLLAILVILSGNLLFLPLSALLVLAWAWRSRTPWAALGFSRPRSWWITAVAGVLLGVAFKLVMKSALMPLIGAPPINEAYRWLQGNTAALPGVIYALVVGAGFGEETVFRGFFFERLGRLLGRGPVAKLTILLVSSGLFGLAHLADQGLPGAQQATFTGLAFGALYLATGSLWLPMVTHAAFDLTALVLIDQRLEWRVAHWFFR